MDIVQILDSRGIGGIETHVRVAAIGLRAAGHAVRVVFLRRYEADHPIAESLRLAGVSVVYADRVGGLWRFLCVARPDIVHCHGYKATLVARSLCRLLQIPSVATYHAGEAVSGKLKLYTTLDRWSAVGGTNIAVSEEIAKTLPGAVSVLDNFIDIPATTAPLSGNRLAFIGRLSEEKAPERFCALAKRMPDLEADVYGEGPMLADLAERFGERVTFHGAVANIGMRLLNTDLVVMPSRQEGLPMTALEAMGHGVPVAATAVGGLPGLIQDGVNGFLVAAETPFGLEEKIRAFFSAPVGQRREMGVRARETIQARYATTVQIPKLVALYRQAGVARGRLHVLAA